MRLHRTINLIALIALLLLPNHMTGQGKGPLSPFNDQQLKNLQAGEPICKYLKKEDGSVTAGNGECSIIINAPIDRCFEILSKIDLQVHYVPNKVQSNIVNRSGDKLLISNEYRQYGITLKYHSIYTINNNKYLLEWEIDKSKPHDVDENTGFYQLEKIDEKTTLLTYGSTKLVVGIKVPEAVTKFLLGKSLPAMATNIKKYIESNGKWRQGK